MKFSTLSNENSHAKFRDNLRFPRVPSPLMNKFGIVENVSKVLLFPQNISSYRNSQKNTGKRVMENRLSAKDVPITRTNAILSIELTRRVNCETTVLSR